MKYTTYDSVTNLASIGPGGNWGDVYLALTPYNVTVVGGRDADVGRSGYLLGGGNSYYTGRQGFGCDAVSSFEVILTNGTIINANQDEIDDLCEWPSTIPLSAIETRHAHFTTPINASLEPCSMFLRVTR